VTAAATTTLVRGVPHTMPTPRKLRFYLLGVWALAALLFLVGEGTLGRARGAMKTIGKDAAPSILAAQEIGSALADLDANAANYLIGTPAHRAQAITDFEKRRTQATQRLVDAAQNITYGDAEKIPILTMVEDLGRYFALFGEARYRYDTGDRKGAIDTYRAATALMHAKILTAAQQLDAANRGYMDDVYASQRRASEGAEGLAVVVGVALLAVLFSLQLFLFRRMRRVFNVPVVAATALVLFYTWDLVTGFGAAREDLRIAKNDAFESIHLLWKARTIAYDANGDESRYLMDRENATQHEDAFFSHARQLGGWDPMGAPVSGIFADELANVTFEGEEAAARAMVKAWNDYHAIDARIRQLERVGKHDQAVQLCIGTGQHESNAAFARFDEALMEVVRINKAEFDEVIERGDGALRRAEFMDPIVAIAIALLTWFGLRARLREYSA
jgi:hypothetical protein